MEEKNECVGFKKRRAEGHQNKSKKHKTTTLNLKDYKPDSSNTICYLQILGIGMDTHNTLPTVLLFFDNQSFIFNAGEGLQRYCTEHKIKLSKINHIFLSRVCSETESGLPGLLLTLVGMGEGRDVNEHGPSDLKYLVNAMRSFTPNAALVKPKSFGPSLGSDATSMPEQSNFMAPSVLVADYVVKISANLLQTKFSEGKHGDASVVYVCELADSWGKLDKEKALAFGVKPGPKYGQLKDGHAVKSDSQDIMVHPSDVMDSIPGPIVFLVDRTESHLQQLLSMQSLDSCSADFSNPPESSKVVNCIIHLSPSSMVSSPNYQKWKKRFGSVQHIMAGQERKNMEIPILKSSARIAARLNYLCPQFFPAQGFGSFRHLGCSTSNSNISSEDSNLKLCESVAAENLLKFTLRPHHKLGVDRSCIPSSTSPAEIIDELQYEILDIAIAAEYVNQLWHASTGSTRGISSTQDVTLKVEKPWLNEKNLPSCLENIKRDDLEIALLGIGSSQPSKYRNVSSIHVNLFSKGVLLLDCGEGKLKRRYDINGADNAIRDLRCIWISHIREDHHAGLARILALRRDLLKEEPREPILVVGPRQLKRYLDAYQRLEDLDMMFLDRWHTTMASLNACEGVFESTNNHFSTGDSINSNVNSNKPTNGQIAQKIDSTFLARGSHMGSYSKGPGSLDDNAAGMKSLKKVLCDAGLEDIISILVVHCPQAFGVVLKAAERTNSIGKVIPGWKIVHSGDTGRVFLLFTVHRHLVLC